MTKRQVQRAIERQVAPRFPSFRPVGDLLVSRSGPILRGFAFERSMMDRTTFRLRAFGQLLSIPSNTVTFGLSHELGNFRVDGDADAAFAAAAEKADAQGREFLSQVEDCAAMLDNLESISSATVDHRLVGEIRAHLLVQLRRDEEAIQALDEVADELSPPEVEYEEDALARVKELRGALARSRGEGIALLEKWTRDSAKALDVEDVPT
jgi:hypothetical protein